MKIENENSCRETEHSPKDDISSRMIEEIEINAEKISYDAKLLDRN